MRTQHNHADVTEVDSDKWSVGDRCQMFSMSGDLNLFHCKQRLQSHRQFRVRPAVALRGRGSLQCAFQLTLKRDWTLILWPIYCD